MRRCSLVALLLAACAWLGDAAFAQELRAVPVLSASVIDQTATLTPTQVSALEAKLAAFEREAGSQLVVLIVTSTLPEDIASFAQRVGEAWKIGRREVGDGLLIVVAKDDKKLRIEVAKALEGAVPDLAAKQIIDRALTPAFRAGDYAGGLNAAIDSLGARIRGEALPLPAAPRAGAQRSQQGTQWPDLALFFLLGVPVIGSLATRVLGRKLGTAATGLGAGGLAWLASASLLVTGGAALVALVLVGVLGVGAARRGGGGLGFPPVIGGGGGGWGGGGGGGFSSGGGGDFGGGGASGDW